MEIVFNIAGIVTGVACLAHLYLWRRAEHRAAYNARGWGEARDKIKKYERTLQIIADDDVDGNEALIAAKVLGLCVPQDERYLAAYFQRKTAQPAQPLQGPHKEEWQP